MPKDGSPISELSVDAAAPREPVAEAAAAVGETTPGGPASGTRRCDRRGGAVTVVVARSAVAQRVHARRAETTQKPGRDRAPA